MKKKHRKNIIGLALLLSLASSNTASSFVRLKLDHKYIIDKDGMKLNPHTIYNYNDFIENSYNINLNNNYIPQGITLYNEYTLISLYNKQKNKNSIIQVYDNLHNLINIFETNDNAHVGGICYDEENNLIWLTSKDGYIETYNPNDIINNTKIQPIQKFDVGENLPCFNNKKTNSVSYLTINNNYIYVGNFSDVSNGNLKKYKIINKNNYIHLKYISTTILPSKVQGICFYEYNNKQYLIVSRSYRMNCPSLIQIFKYDENITKYTDNTPHICYDSPAMLEQISIKNNELHCVFESNAAPYKHNSSQNIKDINTCNIYKMIKE